VANAIGVFGKEDWSLSLKREEQAQHEKSDAEDLREDSHAGLSFTER
jgi:hypothetical protein